MSVVCLVLLRVAGTEMPRRVPVRHARCACRHEVAAATP
jgi:hypothetical protein